MNKPLINILTRTSGRPNYFKLCKESILNQTYDNINHIVSVDDYESMEYVKNTKTIFVKKCNCHVPPVQGRRPALHNLYFNRLHEEVKEGWIMYLDDDDILYSPNAIQTMVDKITSNDDILLWRVSFPTRLVPEDQYFGSHPVFGHFSGIGFLYHSKFAKHWFGYSGGDYDYISTIWKEIKNKIWIDEILTSIGDGVGNGQRKDIEL